MAFAAISAMRWGEYSDYIGVYGTGSADAGVTYVHANPKYINVNRWEFKDKSGKLLIQDIVRTARAGGGFVEYLAPRSAGGAELRKVSYVGAFGAGDKLLALQAGAYVDDVDAVVFRRMIWAGLAGLAGLAIAAFAAFWLGRGLVVPLKQNLLGHGRTGQGQSCGRHSVRRPDQRDRPDCAKPAGLQGSSGRDDAAPHRAGSDEDALRRGAADGSRPHRRRLRAQHWRGDPGHRHRRRRAAEFGFVDVHDRGGDDGSERQGRGRRRADRIERSDRRGLGGGAVVLDPGDRAAGHPVFVDRAERGRAGQAGPRPWSGGWSRPRKRSARSWR